MRVVANRRLGYINRSIEQVKQEYFGVINEEGEAMLEFNDAQLGAKAEDLDEPDDYLFKEEAEPDDYWVTLDWLSLHFEQAIERKE